MPLQRFQHILEGQISRVDDAAPQKCGLEKACDPNNEHACSPGFCVLTFRMSLLMPLPEKVRSQ